MRRCGSWNAFAGTLLPDLARSADVLFYIGTGVPGWGVQDKVTLWVSRCRDPATRAVPGPGRARYARRAGALNRKRRGKTLFVQSWPVRRCRPAWRASHTAPDSDRTDGRHRHARNLTPADRGRGAGAVRHDGYFRYVKGGAGDIGGAKRTNRPAPRAPRPAPRAPRPAPRAPCPRPAPRAFPG
jgi:hypothetical protein